MLLCKCVLCITTLTCVYTLSTAKINETSTFGPADDDITFDYDGDDYGDDNDEEDIVDAVSNSSLNVHMCIINRLLSVLLKILLPVKSVTV